MSAREVVGVDVGGTFTDLVAVSADDGRVRSGKVLSTPQDQSVGVEQGLRELTSEPATISRVVHGTTVVTNMLLERNGARVVLCATAGMASVLRLRRQERASLFDLSRHHPAPLVADADVMELESRIEPQGVVRSLTPRECKRVADAIASMKPEIIAVSLLHAYVDPTHEQMIADALRERCPGVDVVCSSEVLPEIREYERTATTVCEAYARPGVARYLRNLSDRLATIGFPSPGVVASHGGMRDAHDAARHAASLALSGPAGGVAGAALIVKAAGFADALTVDIGGTSADVGLILNGMPLVESGGAVAGVPIALPRVLVETVSAGGGSLGWIDAGGALRVGPRSAGAVPGPAAFGRGGTEATVTDAHVTLGNINADRMGGGVQISRAAAQQAVGLLAKRLKVTPERCADAMIASADAEMARALRRVSVERGVDPRKCVLVAFGGGGPLHACGLATALGMRTVLVPPFAGVLSALGLASAPERRDHISSIMRLTSPDVAPWLAAEADEGRRRAGGTGDVQWIVRCRFVGQGHELEVPFDPAGPIAALEETFRAMHVQRYGFILEAAVEMVSLRCTVTGTAPTLRLEANAADQAYGTTATVPDESGRRVRGRAVIALADATVLVADGWTARPLPIGGWLLENES